MKPQHIDKTIRKDIAGHREEIARESDGDLGNKLPVTRTISKHGNDYKEHQCEDGTHKKQAKKPSKVNTTTTKLTANTKEIDRKPKRNRRKPSTAPARNYKREKELQKLRRQKKATT